MKIGSKASINSNVNSIKPGETVSSQTLETQVQQQLKTFIVPYLQQDLISSNAIKKLEITQNSIRIDITLGFPLNESIQMQLKTSLQQHLLALDACESVEVSIKWQVVPHVVQPGTHTLPTIKNIIAIASAKGGVGKSTTSINLALAMAADGAQVGLLDADIYGPNQPLMLGIHERPTVVEDKKLKPFSRYGLQTMSIGYLVGDKTPMIWRGPMVSSALQQLINDTLWPNLDYLLIDMPPGTGDIHLTLAQKIPIAGTVIVTTPQDVALLDARKGIEMFRKVKLPVLGIIENMSYYHCPACGHHDAIFGEAGGQKLAADCTVPLLGQLPLATAIRFAADAGQPIVHSQPDSEYAQAYFETARRLLAQLSLQKINYASKLPKVVVENK